MLFALALCHSALAAGFSLRGGLDRRLGVSCVCGGARPCQHSHGSCYPTQLHVGGSSTCPPDTSHCACPCAGEHPCQDEVRMMCTRQRYVLGAMSCPAGTLRCVHYDGAGAGETAPHTFAPSPAPRHAEHVRICGCSGSRPCITTTSETCVAGGAAGCPATADLCHCGCGTGATVGRPCQHNVLNICMPAFGQAGSESCPAGSTRCLNFGPDEAHTTAAPTQPPALGTVDKDCTCGGGKPCQLDSTLAASHGHAAQCFDQGRLPSGALACPLHTAHCVCECEAEAPCKFYNAQLDRIFCFALDGLICPAKTVLCHKAPAHPAELAYDALTASGALADDSSTAPVDCVHSGWSAWSDCSKTCGAGVQVQLPHIASPAERGGAACPQHRERECNLGSCTAVDCAVSGWTAWSACSAGCGGSSVQSRRPIITTLANRLGQQCPAVVTRPCGRVPCMSDLHCKCNPFLRTLDPDSPPASKNDVQCTRVNGSIKVLFPQHLSYFKCGYSGATGCACCMCHVRACKASAPGAWGACAPEWFARDNGMPCPCDESSATPCASVHSSGVVCVGKISTPAGQACPTHTSPCAGRQQLLVERRVSNAAGNVFLSESCPQQWEFRPCGAWASTPAEPDLGLGGVGTGVVASVAAASNR
jgi:hypothetical protein